MGIFGDVIEELVERTDSGIMKWSPFDPQAGWRVASLRYACQVFPTYRRFDVTVREVRGEATTVTIRDAEEIIPLIEALLRKHPRKMDRGRAVRIATCGIRRKNRKRTAPISGVRPRWIEPRY